MPKRKFVITHDISPDYKRKFEDMLPDWEIVAGKEKKAWENHIQDAEVIAGWRKEFEEACLGPDSKLRWIQTWSAGVDSLPLKEFENKQITLTSANGVHSYPISETIFALMLGLTRKIHTYVRNQQAKVWHHAHIGLEMHEKTVGILGIGAIGKETAKIAKAFGMHVIGFRNSNKPEEFVDEMYGTDQLNEVLPRCDYVVITLPLTAKTSHLFGKEQFQLMKNTAFFINIGRGEIVSEADMVDALKQGMIAGAGLDVFETEPLAADSPLWEMENVIITPHTSGSTVNYDKRVIEDILIPNLKSYASGSIPSINLVDFVKGY